MGALTLDSAAVSADDAIDEDDIDASRLVFTPVAHEHGNDYAAFRLKVNDAPTGCQEQIVCPVS